MRMTQSQVLSSAQQSPQPLRHLQTWVPAPRKHPLGLTSPLSLPPEPQSGLCLDTTSFGSPDPPPVPSVCLGNPSLGVAMATMHIPAWHLEIQE